MTNEAIYLHQNNKWLRSHSETKAEIPHDVAIRRIEANGGHYDPNIEGFDAWDQLLVSEGLARSTFIHTEHGNINETTTSNTSVNGMSNDTCKRKATFELTESKQELISKLSSFTYKTAPREIEVCLTQFFVEWPSKPGHWLFVAQKWTPRAINRSINKIVKQHVLGTRSIQNPPGYFMCELSYRKSRRV
jgi:hypothetical protein